MLDEHGATSPGPKVAGGQDGQLSAYRVGDVLGGTYRIERKVGSGGMADVYEVQHLRLHCGFAAKVLRPRGPADPSVRRFLREAQLLAALKSDHIVTVFDVSGADQPPFYVMELLEGRDLRRLLSENRELSISRATKIIADACLGIDVVHAAGLVHRDLKPENLFFTHRDTGEEVCKLLDFGVVKTVEGMSTERGALIGTVRYMAPEQIEQSGNVGPRVDVRGLGTILYECLAGRPPYAADSVEKLFFSILNEDAPPIRTYRPSVPAGLEAVVLRALERDPVKRFQSAQALGEALRPFTETSNSERGSMSTGTQARSPRSQFLSVAGARSRRRASPGIVLAVSGAIGLSGLGAFALLESSARRAEALPKVSSPTTSVHPAPAPPDQRREDTREPPHLVRTDAVADTAAERAASSSSGAAKARPRSVPSGAGGARTPRPEGSSWTAPLVVIDPRNPYSQ